MQIQGHAWRLCSKYTFVNTPRWVFKISFPSQLQPFPCLLFSNRTGFHSLIAVLDLVSLPVFMPCSFSPPSVFLSPINPTTSPASPPLPDPLLPVLPRCNTDSQASAVTYCSVFLSSPPKSFFYLAAPLPMRPPASLCLTLLALKCQCPCPSTNRRAPGARDLGNLLQLLQRICNERQTR